MYPLLIFLFLFNATLLVWNVFVAPGQQEVPPALVDQNTPSLELRKDVEQVQYSSGTDGSHSSCYTIGPYNSDKAAQQVAAKIREFGLAVQERPMRSMETLNFLVYIPPLKDQAEAEKVEQDIARFDVQDVSIINDGPYRNAISLGFFTNLNKARRHAEYIRYLGYDARYTERKAAREVFWLDYDEPFGNNTPVQQWSATIDATSEVQRIPRACR